ncbi:MAG: hypothetical protein ABFD29_01630 [Anaerolineaceae bacterium]
MSELPEVSQVEDEKNKLNKRFETISWGLFLVMIGGMGLVPDAMIPNGTWLIGVGLIMLGLNLARYLNHIKVSNFTLILGVIALLSGTSDYFNIDLPFFAILLIIIGAGMLIKPLFEK